MIMPIDGARESELSSCSFFAFPLFLRYYSIAVLLDHSTIVYHYIHVYTIILGDEVYQKIHLSLQ